MRLAPGARLGSYEVVSALGSGGMGEVYRARDGVLQRDVAVKLIHQHFCDREDSVARFRREARALAALNHPHVAAIYELGEADAICFLVMELVDGATLEEVLKRESLRPAEALRLSMQIASALEAAHEKGIIHRDLKPANIKVTPEGIAKVLDFGLAKALASDSMNPLSRSPTLSTGEGIILGTAAYMSPEQARGKPVDRRADVWAFGCVLFEMLSGRRPFVGETMSDTMVGILEREPPWDLLPASTPPAIRRLLRRCLDKDPQRRLRDMGDARLEIEDAFEAPAASGIQRPVAGARSRLTHMVALLAAGAVGGAAIPLLIRDRDIRAPQPAHFIVPLPVEAPLSGLDFPALAVSPDGTHIAFVAARGGRTQILVRPLNATEPTALSGTADAIGPFFSPDSRWIAFFSEGRLKKAPLAGGPAVTICPADIGFGGTWGADDTIVFSPTTGAPLFRVTAAGGTPSRVTTLDAARGEFSHRWPELLPDGRTVLFTVGTVGSWDDAEIVAQSLTSSERRVLVKGGTHPRYLASGHLLYARGGAIMAVRFDPARLAVLGSPMRVLDNVLTSFDGASQLGVSRSGILAYVPANPEGSARNLVVLGRDGAAVPFAAPPRAYATPRASPDGRRLAVTIAGATEDLWVYQVTDGTLRQLTFEADNSAPVWTPDGQHVTFSSSRSGARNLFNVRADGTGAPERLTSSGNVQLPGAWSSNGVLVYVEHDPETGRDIWTLRRVSDRPVPFIRTPSDESAPRFSPDGRWVAYVSNETGESEVYVRVFEGSAQRWRVSNDGGAEPVWAGNGRELFYRAGDRLMAAPVLPGREFRTGPPRVVFDTPLEKGTFDTANYDVTAGGQQFVFVRPVEQQSPQGRLHVVLNWFETLRVALPPE